MQLEDLHWADAGTFAATSFLTRAIHAQPIGIVATYRTDGASSGPRLRPWLAEVTRAGIMERLELEPRVTQGLRGGDRVLGIAPGRRGDRERRDGAAGLPRGDLSGFTPLRGDGEKLARLRMAPGFQRITWRASVCLAKIGVVPAFVDAGAADTLAAYREAIADLA